MTSAPRREMFQNAYVVRDLLQSIKEWTELLHAGPFFILDGGFEAEKRYRGQTCADTYTGAVGFRGELIIELLQPINAAPSVFREILGDERSRFHHVHHLRQLTPKEYDDELSAYQRRGYGLAYTASVPGMGRAAFVDTYEDFGFFVEVMETTPVIFDALEICKAAHKDWDGKDPVRQFPAIFAR